MKYSFWYRNGLTLVLTTIFLFLLALQSWFGWKEYKSEMAEKGGELVDFASYFGTAHFWEATFENWESEFLQMGMYVIITVYLRQLGSSESKKLGEKEEVDREPQPHEKAPWAVKRGGLILKIYSNSLSISFLLLFLISFIGHTLSSHKVYNKEQLLQGQAGETMMEYLGNSRLWFESFQNWQSEFIAVLSIVFLSIYFRQKGSPESKPVDAPNNETGS